MPRSALGTLVCKVGDVIVTSDPPCNDEGTLHQNSLFLNGYVQSQRTGCQRGLPTREISGLDYLGTAAWYKDRGISRLGQFNLGGRGRR
jgi:hypothetical protein